MTTVFGALELNWHRLQAFDFFLWPEMRRGIRGVGIVRGSALIRSKEHSQASPFPQNQIVRIIARVPASLKRGLQEAQGSDMVFVKFYGYKFYKGQPPRRARFFCQGVSSKREQEILQACRIPSNQWP